MSWSRVLPSGRGAVSGEGLDFYRRLCAGMVERGIEPCLTLYHWDLPQALQDEGGWANRRTLDAFGEYATLLGQELGDLVSSWITHNEPWVSAFLGHRDGVFAPGLSDWPLALEVAHNMLVSHGLAASAIREAHPQALVGIALDCRPSQPADEASEKANRHFDGFRNRWFFDPVFGRGYPEDMVEAYEQRGRLPGGLDRFVRSGDMDLVGTEIDFLGINYYTTIRVSAGEEESDEPEGPSGPHPAPGFTEMGWKIDADGLLDFLRRVRDDYAPRAIYITENGASFSDAPDELGKVEDQRRIDYLVTHVDAVLQARDEGIPVEAYYVWSFLDNLEWLQGFTQRFGLVWVDPSTLERIPKLSYEWYRETIAANRKSPKHPAQPG